MSATAASWSTLRGLHAEIVRMLTAAPLSLVHMDRIDIPAAVATQTADRCVFIRIPATSNTDRERGPASALVDDQVEVFTLTRINPKDQLATQYDAWDLEDDVRVALTARHQWGAHWDPVYLGTPARGPSTNSAEWYVIQQTFRFRRYAQLGG